MGQETAALKIQHTEHSLHSMGDKLVEDPEKSHTYIMTAKWSREIHNQDKQNVGMLA